MPHNLHTGYYILCVCVCVCTHMHTLSHVQLFATPWTVAHQAPLSMGFPRQEHWSGLPFPSSKDLADPGIEPVSPALLANYWLLHHLGSSNILEKILFKGSSLQLRWRDSFRVLLSYTYTIKLKGTDFLSL